MKARLGSPAECTFYLREQIDATNQIIFGKSTGELGELLPIPGELDELWRIGSGTNDQKVTEVLNEPARETPEISPPANQFVDNGKDGTGLAVHDGTSGVGQDLVIDEPQQLGYIFLFDLRSYRGENLIERGESIPQTAFRRPSNLRNCSVFDLYPLVLGNTSQLIGDDCAGQGAELELLTPR